MTPLDRLLLFLLGDAFVVLACQFSPDPFFILSFRRGLIVKVLLHGVLINRLPVLDAVELGGCSSLVLRSHIGVVPFVFQSNSCCRRTGHLRAHVNSNRYCGWLSFALVNLIDTVICSRLRL